MQIETPYTVPTVSRVDGDKIIELVFDAKQRVTAFAVAAGDEDAKLEKEVQVAGERLVPYSARNNLIQHGCVLLPSRPEVSGPKHILMADIRAFLHRYVDLSPGFEAIAAHYVLLTWLYDAFAEVPYLRVRGDYGTGKTRALIAIGSLCNKPFFAAGASTVSPIFHTLDRFRGTLVLDEADFRFTDATADLVKIFNNGTVKGLPVLRTIQNGQKEFNPVAFNVFGPKIIAMRGSFEDEALESRFLTEETGARTLRRNIPLHLPESLHGEALTLRNRLLDFRLRNLSSTQPKPERAAPELDARGNQIALPLLSLMDDPGLRLDVAGLLCAGQTANRAARNATLQARVLESALRVLAASTGGAVAVQDITDDMNKVHGNEQGTIAARRVGAILQNTFRIVTRKSHGVYVVDQHNKTALQVAAERYGIATQFDPHV